MPTEALNINRTNCWLLLEKSEETRVSMGFDGYRDKTGEEYNYDSFVPNFRNIGIGDLAVIRKENTIVGYGTIGSIDSKNGTKNHRRCPKCSNTDVRQRTTITPEWKCGRCSHEFKKPNETIDDAVLYSAKLESFTYFDNAPSVMQVKSCAARNIGTNSQLSMLPLNPIKLRKVIGDVDLSDASYQESVRSPGQGIGLSYEERKAVEMHAMDRATEHYRNAGWDVADVSRAKKGYDLLASKNDAKRFIEVKGTTTRGETVVLTRREIAHAKDHKEKSVLFVVSEITINETEESWQASGGKIFFHADPWIIDDDLLTPTQFRYEIPASN